MKYLLSRIVGWFFIGQIAAIKLIQYFFFFFHIYTFNITIFTA